MVRKFLFRVLPLVLGMGIMLAPVSASAAYDPFGNVDCNSKTSPTATSAICATKPKSLAGPGGVIVTVANFVALIAGVAAVIILLIASIKYITAGGDAKEVESAKNTIIYAVIGILVIVSAKVLITYVVNKVG